MKLLYGSPGIFLLQKMHAMSINKKILQCMGERLS